MNSYYKLNFNTDKETTFSLRVPNADESVESSTINDIMDNFISLNAFVLEEGNLISKKSASLVTTTNTPFAVK